jgi:hypothetical protein
LNESTRYAEIVEEVIASHNAHADTLPPPTAGKNWRALVDAPAA